MNSLKELFDIIEGDIRMNLIAALIVLIMTNPFDTGLRFPFDLVKVAGETVHPTSLDSPTTDILIYREHGIIMIKTGEKSVPFEHLDQVVETLNVKAPVQIIPEKQCGLDTDALIGLFAKLNTKGVHRVSIAAQKTP